MIPKTLSIIVSPTLPNFLWMKSADFKKTKIAIEFKTIPTRITAVEKSWFKDIIVDSVPGPAIIGNAIGKI